MMFVCNLSKKKFFKIFKPRSGSGSNSEENIPDEL